MDFDLDLDVDLDVDVATASAGMSKVIQVSHRQKHVSPKTIHVDVQVEIPIHVLE